MSSPASGQSARIKTGALTLGAIGVVYGDIGTSPLYAFREALAQSAAGGIVRAEILGVLSLALWALILVVTIKYILFLTRTDNAGEGGVLSLMALARRATGGWTIITVLGALGAALFYGDAIITPALSVLSAVEGLKTIDGIAPWMSEARIITIAVGILIGLFAIQSFGTASVSRLFGPVCVVWFLAIGSVGLMNIAAAPEILLAFNPLYAVAFMLEHGLIGLFVLGAVFLTVTGAEALTADMGHFGRLPIQLGWFLLVFPSLTLNYLGQGAFALDSLTAAQASGRALASADWFFLMTPESIRLLMVALATMATIIASQTVITGAYSLTQQAISLGLFPRMKIRQTSEDHSGQIYVPVINWLLLAGVMILILQFRNSSAMAAAYGIAVTGTMVVTTCLAFIVIWKLWQWRPLFAALFIAPFLLLDIIFFGANILRVIEGGWVPLLIAAGICLLVRIWLKGRVIMAEQLHRDRVSLDELAVTLAARPPHRIEGTAVFLTADPDAAPVALLHNLKHNRVLHQRNIVLTVSNATKPRISDAERLTIAPIDANFCRATLRYGYMESPDIPSDLHRSGEVPARPGGTSFFVGRHMLSASHDVGLPFWQDVIFIFLQRNASDPTAFFQIPPNRVVELGTRVEV
ncbi:potassium transporter Kup [Sphingomonas sp. SRS2]|uniref:potassium transporter Kup n=1 Tax=Sphingomonas sp. SRS2 TaxID=133190 RepID=UPI0006184D52|nr:potassium transporter Kup [Sphingomonas sp. SRS2]KKC24064.1 potassium transport protein Kup [Sphingomonas sp. SRS2]